MKKLTDIDKNFITIDSMPEGTKLYNIREGVFEIYGLYKPHSDGDFRRIPYELAKSISSGLLFNHAHTAGGRVRFKTDAEYIFLKAIFPDTCIMPHMPATGSSGFDIYIDNDFHQTFVPTLNFIDEYAATFCVDGGYEAVTKFPDRKMRDIIINFPLYNNVSDVYIGLPEDCKLEKGNSYKHKVPVVYYGSSITQGGCASRPGNSYQAILSRRLDCDFINLGFSGSARAEEQMYNYIKDLDMSVFVYDYDFNAPSAEYLSNTHSKMFWAIREKNPDLPVIMLTKPNIHKLDDDSKKRIDIIYKTYTDAKEKGDNNVYFINGHELCNSFDPNMMTVDGVHPTDFGFFSMANAIEKVLAKLL
ncbi:MAG: hypothetical protein IJA19_05005 [Clostridia bacterium]|nr:hypothetical protein [Clostridia bacterium]